MIVFILSVEGRPNTSPADISEEGNGNSSSKSGPVRKSISHSAGSSKAPSRDVSELTPEKSATRQANPTEAQHTGYNFPNFRSFRVLFRANSQARQTGKVHCAFLVTPFSAVSVKVAVTEYRYKLMLLVTKPRY